MSQLQGALALENACGVVFFFQASLVELTNYVIRHISKYSNTMISFARTLCLHGCTSPHLASLANPSRWCLLKIQTLKVIHITGEFTIMDISED